MSTEHDAIIAQRKSDLEKAVSQVRQARERLATEVSGWFTQRCRQDVEKAVTGHYDVTKELGPKLGEVKQRLQKFIEDAPALVAKTFQSQKLILETPSEITRFGGNFYEISNNAAKQLDTIYSQLLGHIGKFSGSMNLIAACKRNWHAAVD